MRRSLAVELDFRELKLTKTWQRNDRYFVAKVDEELQTDAFAQVRPKAWLQQLLARYDDETTPPKEGQGAGQ